MQYYTKLYRLCQVVQRIICYLLPRHKSSKLLICFKCLCWGPPKPPPPESGRGPGGAEDLGSYPSFLPRDCFLASQVSLDITSRPKPDRRRILVWFSLLRQHTRPCMFPGRWRFQQLALEIVCVVTFAQSVFLRRTVTTASLCIPY